MPENITNKYFIPLIEDIRVGYECEIWEDERCFIRGKVTKVYQGTQNEESCLGLYIDNGNGFLIDRYRQIRVPYLTREQIESEGWEYSANYEAIEDSKFPDELGFLKELQDNLTQFLLYYDPNSHCLRIEKIYNCGGEGWIFRGKCKDINTFRYICKLLNIN